MKNNIEVSRSSLTIKLPQSVHTQFKTTTIHAPWKPPQHYCITWFMLIITIALIPVSVQGQTVQWAQSGNATGSFNSARIGVDGGGNSYITGFYNGTATFGATELISSGQSDVYVAKYDSSGSEVWVKSFGGGGVELSDGIAVDSAGNSYITGLHTSGAQFGAFTLSAGIFDIFVAKLDSSGTVLWAKAAGGAGQFDQGAGIAIDGSGNSYVTGKFQGTATFDSIVLSSGNMFVAKYDPNGNVLWAVSASGASRDIAVDSAGNSYVIGDYGGTATFGAFVLNTAGASDIFVAKYDSSGNVQWAQSAGGTQSEAGRGIDVDSLGNSYVTGSFQGASTFGTFMIIGGQVSNFFVSKYDNSGNVVWVQSDGGTTNLASGRGITVDVAGNSYVTGNFSGGVFGPFMLNDGAFIANYDTDGNALWAQSGGPGAAGLGVDIDTAGNSYISGSYGVTATFGPFTLIPEGSTNIFLAKYSAYSGGPSQVPTLSAWSMFMMALVLVVVGTIVFSNSRRMTAQ